MSYQQQAQEELQRQQTQQEEVTNDVKVTTTTATTATTSLSTNQKNNNNNLKKSVSFNSCITILEFPMELGDNPSCRTGGAPIQIGWKFQDSNQYDLEAFEQVRKDNRRYGSNLILSIDQRDTILLNAGFTPTQILESTIEVEAIQRHRRKKETKIRQGYTTIDQLLKKAIDKLIHLLHLSTHNNSCHTSTQKKMKRTETMASAKDVITTTTNTSSNRCIALPRPSFKKICHIL